MRIAHPADWQPMPKGKESPAEEQAMKPAMRDLILSFDAKDRRDETAQKPKPVTKERRRRVTKPPRAA
jgi:hypothetical protein